MKKALRRTVIAAALLLCIPAQGVFHESDLGLTIRSLRHELKDDYEKRKASDRNFAESYLAQRMAMVSTMKKCNELAIMLYSQKQDYTFDLSYALENVTDEYESYKSRRLPYDQMVERLDWDIERYARLVESLRRITPEIKHIEGLPDSLAYRNAAIDTFRIKRALTREELLRLKAARDSVEREKALQAEKERQERIADSLAAMAGDSAAIARIARRDSLAALEAKLKAKNNKAQEDNKPFRLEGQELIDRDSCIFYATELLKLSANNKRRIIADSTYYQRTFLRLEESYDYAQSRYKQLQNRIFVQGQTPYPQILSGFSRWWTYSTKEFVEKYDFDDSGQPDSSSSWRGPLVIMFLVAQLLLLLLSVLVAALIFNLLLLFVKPLKARIPKSQYVFIALLFGFVLAAILAALQHSSTGFIGTAASLVQTYLWLFSAILLTLLIRVSPDSLKNSFLLYLPVMILAMFVISLRIVFMPNAMMNIVYPPMLLLFFVWQLIACIRHAPKAQASDRIFGWISLGVTVVAFGVSFAGYIFIGLLIQVWWYFQLAAALTLIAITHLMDKISNTYMKSRIEAYKSQLTFLAVAERDNMVFGATWFVDLLRTVVLPVLALVSLPLCLNYALGVFDFNDLYDNLLTHPFVNLTNTEGIQTFRLSFSSIITAGVLFFAFRYMNYAIYSVYQSIRYSTYLRKSGLKKIRKDEINLSLGRSIISLLVWFVYIVIIVVMLRIPTSSITIIAGGLSAGIGIALKDVLNNFIYGIQLMSGRVRVGDWIECDGDRGRVTAIGYQTTQVETPEDVMLSFPNAYLFNKTFRNLTKNNYYEFLRIDVGVSYGTDVQKVREVLTEAMQVLRTKDSYGREIVEPKKGIYVVFGGFEDSAVRISVKQFVLVSERVPYSDKAKEVIYKALGDAGITIPFPQRDLHIYNE